MMTRLPKPKILDDLAGNPTNKRGDRCTEPTPTKAKPKMPRHLDAQAKACWKDTVKALDQMALLSNVDAKSLERYCCAYSRWRKAMKEIQETEGIPGRHLSCEANNTADQMLKFEQQFGLSPVARAKLRVDNNAKKEDDNPFRKFGIAS